MIRHFFCSILFTLWTSFLAHASNTPFLPQARGSIRKEKTSDDLNIITVIFLQLWPSCATCSYTHYRFVGFFLPISKSLQKLKSSSAQCETIHITWERSIATGYLRSFSQEQNLTETTQPQPYCSIFSTNLHLVKQARSSSWFRMLMLGSV